MRTVMEAIRRNRYSVFAIIAVFIVILFFVVSDFTYKPRIWVDEASAIEQAHNLLRFHVPDIQVAPGVMAGIPYLLQSTGYPVQVPLAAFFKLFGFGFEQARLYMLFWLFAALIAAYLFARKFLGSRPALLSFFLVASFASFYASGLTVVGEIPGFVLLLAALYLLLNDSYFGAGLIMGLSVSAKPSVFGLAVPAAIAAIFIARHQVWKKIFYLIAGIIPAIVLWFVIVLDGKLSLSVIKDIIVYYSNPFGNSQFENISNNLRHLFVPTLIYFGFFFLAILVVRIINRRSKAMLYDFVIGYSVLAFFYYLKSPGWLRYILIAELLILLLLPHTLDSLSGRFLGHFRFGRINWLTISTGAVMILVSVQLFHFATAADIFYSSGEIKTADFLNENFSNRSVAIFNDMSLSVLFAGSQRYLVTNQTYVPIPKYGTVNTGSGTIERVRPEIVVLPMKKDVSDSELQGLENYRLVREQDGYRIYELKAE